MILYTDEQFNQAKGVDLLDMKCDFCNKEFKIDKSRIKSKSKDGKLVQFCSRKCATDNITKTGTVLVNCLNCNKEYRKSNWSIKKYSNSYCSKKCFGLKNITGKLIPCTLCNKMIFKNAYQLKQNKKLFCSRSCSSTWTNTHKTTPNRSNLEIWLEHTIPTLYPNLKILFNERSIIDSELDIYIPELKLAFELNGPVHYEPIYGIDKLNYTKNNDNRKMLACAEKQISLAVIDTSKHVYLKPNSNNEYLKIITDIIDQNIKLFKISQ